MSRGLDCIPKAPQPKSNLNPLNLRQNLLACAGHIDSFIKRLGYFCCGSSFPIYRPHLQYLFVCLSMFLVVHLHICLSTYLPNLSIHPSIWLCVCASMYLWGSSLNSGPFLGPQNSKKDPKRHPTLENHTYPSSGTLPSILAKMPGGEPSIASNRS